MYQVSWSDDHNSDFYRPLLLLLALVVLEMVLLVAVVLWRWCWCWCSFNSSHLVKALRSKY